MKRISARIGDVIAIEYPPRWIVGDIWDGLVTILAIDRPDETIEDLRAAAVELRATRKAAGQRVRQSRIAR